MKQPSSSNPSYLTIAILIFAGETIFLLPFVLPRIFRPTFLDVFELNNLQLGTCFSIYGTVAMISYLFGGVVADRFQPRKLMSVALMLTALGGFVMANYPSLHTMNFIYGYWGATTIFLFWAAMIKATREWGGSNMQGRAFGFLDGGRGLVAAGIGSIGVLIFSFFMGEGIEDATLGERKEAFRYVMLFASFLVVFIALAVWFGLTANALEHEKEHENPRKLSAANVRTALKIPSVWLLMIIILCGYVGYKTTDDFSLYAKEVMLYDEVKAAQIGTLLLYIRPIVGVAAGFMADRTRTSSWLVIGFLFMLLGSLMLASGVVTAGGVILFSLALLTTCLGVFGIRSLYFAAMAEGHIPLVITGTAVGVISVVGFTPDIFVGPIMGMLLDNSPGPLGHQHVFIMLSGFSLVGMVASFIFWRNAKRGM